jgi:hypothetical protein
LRTPAAVHKTSVPNTPHKKTVEMKRKQSDYAIENSLEKTKVISSSPVKKQRPARKTTIEKKATSKPQDISIEDSYETIKVDFDYGGNHTTDKRRVSSVLPETAPEVTSRENTEMGIPGESFVKLINAASLSPIKDPSRRHSVSTFGQTTVEMTTLEKLNVSKNLAATREKVTESTNSVLCTTHLTNFVLEPNFINRKIPESEHLVLNPARHARNIDLGSELFSNVAEVPRPSLDSIKVIANDIGKVILVLIRFMNPMFEKLSIP